MKQLDFDGLVKISNEGMKALKGGYSIHTVTVTPNRGKKRKQSEDGDQCKECDQCDGDDGIHRD